MKSLSNIPLGHRLLQWFIPNTCLLCGVAHQLSSHHLLCSDCEQQLPLIAAQACCPVCALPTETEVVCCGQCLAHPPAFSASYIPFLYQHPLDALIHQFKYRRQLSSGKLLGDLCLAYLRATNLTQLPDALVPTPIHWRRRWQRCFNQTELLARHLAQGLDIPLIYACKRQSQTASQKELNRDARLKNLRSAFSLEPSAVTQLKGKHIALVDDVVTTTATARTLSELLLKAGAARVDIWAIARTPDH
jgi:ComF family protein